MTDENIMTWDEVVNHPDMQNLSNEDLENARHAYFHDVVKPTVQKQDLDAAWAAFDRDTKPSTIDNALRTGKQVIGGIGDAMKKVTAENQTFEQSMRHPSMEPSALFQSTEARYGLPDGLLSKIAQTESNFNPNAVSPAGAQGLMQFMPATANQYGIDPFNVPSSIDAAGKHMRYLLNKFNGDLPLAVAAYNAGEGNVEKHGGIPPFPETQSYVNKVLGPQQERMSPQRFGLPVTQETFDAVKIKFDSSSPEQRAEMVTRQDWLGRIAQAIDEDYRKADAVLRHDPALQAMGTTTEDRALGYMLQGLEPKQATEFGLRDAALGATPQRIGGIGEQNPIGLAEEAVHSFGGGVRNLQQIGSGLGAFAQDIAGNELAQQSFMEDYQQLAGEAERYTASIPTLKNIGNTEDFMRWGINAIYSNLPMMLPSLVAGGVTGMAAKQAAEATLANLVKQFGVEKAATIIAKRTGAAAFGGAAASSIGMETGSIYGDIAQQTGEGQPGLALAAGVPAGLLDALPDSMVLNRVLGSAAKTQVIGGLIKRLGIEGAKQTLTEGLTEGAQTAIERGAATLAGGQPFLTRETVDDIVESIAQGGLAGGVMGVASESAGQANEQPKTRPDNSATGRNPTRPGPISPTGELNTTPTEIDPRIIEHGNSELANTGTNDNSGNVGDAGERAIPTGGTNSDVGGLREQPDIQPAVGAVRGDDQAAVEQALIQEQEIVTVKDIYGRTIRIRKSDLESNQERIPTVRANGEIWSGEEVPRRILKLTNTVGEVGAEPVQRGINPAIADAPSVQAVTGNVKRTKQKTAKASATQAHHGKAGEKEAPAVELKTEPAEATTQAQPIAIANQEETKTRQDRLRSYDEVQKDIDDYEDYLSKNGVDITKLYPSSMFGQNFPSDWEVMPKKLDDLYKERDLSGDAELTESINDLSMLLGKVGFTNDESKNILKKYELNQDELGATSHYFASKYTEKYISSAVEKQVQDIAIMLATKRGRPLDSISDIPKNDVSDAAKAVKAIRNYFGIQDNVSNSQEITTNEKAKANANETAETPRQEGVHRPNRRIEKPEQKQEVEGVVKEPWQMTSDEYANSELSKSEYREGYEEEPELKNEFLSDRRNDWVKLLNERAKDGRIPDNVLDDFVSRFGVEGLQRNFRGIYEKGASGYVVKNIREKEVNVPDRKKEPYEMTWKEYRQTHEPDGISDKNKGTPRWWKLLKAQHSKIIQKAVFDNHIIPTEVIADYPNIVGFNHKQPKETTNDIRPRPTSEGTGSYEAESGVVGGSERTSKATTIQSIPEQYRPYVLKYAKESEQYNGGRQSFRGMVNGLLTPREGVRLHNEGVLKKIWDEVRNERRSTDEPDGNTTPNAAVDNAPDKTNIKPADGNTRTKKESSGTGNEESVKNSLSPIESFLTESLDKQKEYSDWTETHSLNVGTIARDFARHIGMDEKTVTRIAASALVHDQGKLGIPKEILDAKRALTSEEREVMRNHTANGKEFVGKAPDSIRKSVELATELHHVQSVTVKGLSKQQNAEVQIIKIADVFEALTAKNRPYREPYTRGEALMAMLSEKGHYNPSLMKKFADFQLLTYANEFPKEQKAEIRRALGQTLAPTQPEGLRAAQSIVDAYAEHLGIDAPLVVEDNNLVGMGAYYPSSIPANRVIKLRPTVLSNLTSDNSMIALSANEVVAHEYGHHIAETILASSPEETQLAVERDYADWALEQKEKTVGQIVKSRMTPMRARTAERASEANLIAGGITKEYALSKDEWLADNAARHLLKIDLQGKVSKPTQSIIEKIAEKIKQLWSTVKESLTVAPSLEEFLNNLINRNVEKYSGSNQVFHSLDPIEELEQNPTDFFEELDEAAKEANKTAWTDVKEEFGKLALSVKKERLALLTVRQIGEVSKNVLPNVGEFEENFKMLEASRNHWEFKAGQIGRQLEKISKNKSDARTLTTVIFASTLNGVDPSKHFTATSKADSLLKAKAYRQIKGRYETLSPAAKKVFAEMRSFYDSVLDENAAAIIERIEAMPVSHAAKKEKVLKLKEKYELLKQEGYYFPLSRKGDLWVFANDKNNNPIYSRFTHEAEMNEFKSEIEKSGGNVLGAGLSLDVTPSISQVNPGFVADVDEIVSGMSDHAEAKVIRDSIYQSYLETLPDISVRKHSIHRKGRAGFSTDVMQAFSDSALHGSIQLAKLQYGYKMQDNLRSMQESLDLATSEYRMKQAKESLEQIEYYRDNVMDNMDEKQIRRMQKKSAGLADEKLWTAMLALHSKYGNSDIDVDKSVTHKQSVIDTANAIIKNDNDGIFASTVISELNKAYKDMMNPRISRWSSIANSIGFVMFLGLNPASAIVNSLQTWVVTAPAIGAKFELRPDQVAKELMSAYKDFATGVGDGWVKDIEDTLTEQKDKDMFKEYHEMAEHVGFLPTVARSLKDANERKAFLKFMEIGLIDRTLTFDLSGQADSGLHVGAWRNKTMRVFGFLFQHTERMNREVSAITAYRLAVKHGMAHADAVNYAADVTWDTHGDYSAMNRARFMRSNTARVALQFKQYSQFITYLWGRLLYQSVKGGTKEEKSQARKQLFGMTLMQMAVAGASGLPLGGVYLAAKMIAEMTQDEDEPWDFDEWLRDLSTKALGKTWGYAFRKGIVDAFTPVSISGRTSMSDLWIREPDKELEGMDANYYMWKALGGPMMGISENIWNAAKLFSQGEPKRAAEKLLPAALSSLLKAYRYAKEGQATNLKRVPIIKNITNGEIAGQAFGFTPSRLDEKYDTNNALKRMEDSLEGRREEVMKLLLTAKTGKEVAAANKAKLAWNKANPHWTIRPPDIIRARQGRMRAQRNMEGGVYINPKLDYLRDEIGNED